MKKLTERYLVEKLKEILSPKFQMVWIHQKVSTSNYFKKFISANLGYIPLLQPEFDLILKRRDGALCAIEVKFLRGGKNGYNLPYYHGIGQAMALQRFGFDYVGLWLLVGEGISDEMLFTYGTQARNFIRDELKLSIEYTYFRVVNESKSVKFIVIKPAKNQSGYELMNLVDWDFSKSNSWRNPNLLKDEPMQLIMRKGIEKYLEYVDKKLV